MASSHRDAHPYGRSADDVRRRTARVQRTRRLRITQLVVFSTLVIAIVVIGAYALTVFREPSAEPGVIAEKTFKPKPGEVQCPPDGAKPASPKDVEVRVFNGTDRDGLAGEVSSQLAERGYTMAEAGNTAKAGAPVTLVHGPTGYVAAMSVAAQFGGPESVSLHVDDREGTGVDVLIGDGFRELAEAKAATALLDQPVTAPKDCVAP